MEKIKKKKKKNNIQIKKYIKYFIINKKKIKKYKNIKKNNKNFNIIINIKILIILNII